MFLVGGPDEDEATEQADLRMKRKGKVDGPDAAHVTALIYESALHRRVGTPETMAAQLEHLWELSHRRNVVIQVVPDDGSYFPGLDGEFAIATGPAISDTVDMITAEDHVSDEPDVAGKVIALFEEIRGYALNVAQSRAVITEALQRWRSQQWLPAGASPATAMAADLTASRPVTSPARSWSATRRSPATARSSAFPRKRGCTSSPPSGGKAGVR